MVDSKTDARVYTDQPIFDAITASTRIENDYGGQIIIDTKKFIEAFNSHRDRMLCISLDRKTDAGSIIEEVLVERKKQIAKGYNAKHDDAHNDCSIADAAAQYASTRLLYYRPLPSENEFDRLWPWEDTSFPHPKLTGRQKLIVAIALCFAEIERLDRREELEQSMHLGAIS